MLGPREKKKSRKTRSSILGNLVQIHWTFLDFQLDYLSNPGFKVSLHACDP